MQYDPGFPTILPPFVALLLVLFLNFAAPVWAFLIARKLKRHKWVPHTFALLWVLLSVFTFGLLGMPTLQPDEEPGANDGFILLPIVGESALVFAAYFIAWLWLLMNRLLKRYPL
jgi:hypothetical protein